MKHTKQETLDFRADKKALKKEIKLTKKGISTAKKEIKKQNKLIKKTEPKIGRQYYQERVLHKKPLMYSCDELCGVIRRAESMVKEREAVLDVLDLRLTEAKSNLKRRTDAYKNASVKEIILEQP
ncbi:MAG: hypothetical protein IIY16_03630 [Oscillospiraceae bacterium]|nr:hypothetical protein [Oscillospiraceae bacterium]